MSSHSTARSSVKKVLIISYHFPPDAAVGAIRPAKFAKYLPEFGWQPFILTVKDKYYDEKDEYRLADLNNKLHIIRTSKLPNIRDIYLKAKINVTRIKRKKRQFLEDILSYDVVSQTNNNRRDFRSTIRRIVFSLLVWMPDDKTGWIPTAALRALQIIKKEHIDIILTTSPPKSVHLIGLILKFITGLHWCADFRDPWLAGLKIPKAHFVRTALSDKIEAWMEKSVAIRSDRIISTSEKITDAFAVRYPNANHNKFVTIWNGFDLEDITGLKGCKKYHKFTITYTGTFYLGRTPKMLLKAISELINENKMAVENIYIQFIGNCKYAVGESVEKMIENYNLSKCIRIRDWIPHREALEEVSKSHTLFLLTSPAEHLIIPAKVFEYLGLGANILALINEGPVLELLNNYENAIVVNGKDIAALKKAIMSFYISYLKSDRYGNADIPMIYERRNLTKRLANLLNGIEAT